MARSVLGTFSAWRWVGQLCPRGFKWVSLHAPKCQAPCVTLITSCIHCNMQRMDSSHKFALQSATAATGLTCGSWAEMLYCTSSAPSFRIVKLARPCSPSTTPLLGPTLTSCANDKPMSVHVKQFMSLHKGLLVTNHTPWVRLNSSQCDHRKRAKLRLKVVATLRSCQNMMVSTSCSLNSICWSNWTKLFRLLHALTQLYEHDNQFCRAMDDGLHASQHAMCSPGAGLK